MKKIFKRGINRKKINKEECFCCSGTGLCEDINNNKTACMTCNGSGYNAEGYFEYLKQEK